MAINNLFPTPVGFYKIDRELTEGEMLFINTQDKIKNMGNLTSVDMCVLDSEPLSGVRKFIEDSVADYFTTVHQPIGDLRLNITQSWCNYSEKGQWHHRHTHSNSFISGVFYPQANIAKDKIYFYKDGPFIFSIPRGDNDWNTWNSDSWWFEVGTGDLILFPSSLQHGVDPVDADETRISLSFNTFPVGVLGNDRSLTRLVITDAKG